MAYRQVYNVVDAPVLVDHLNEVGLLGIALIWTIGWMLAYKYASRRGMRRNIWIGILLGAIGAWLVGTKTLPAYDDQALCREWLRSGEFVTTDGVITNFNHFKSRWQVRSSFRIGDVEFNCGNNPTTGGFHGKFTARGTDELRLADGMNVRIAHRDGRILKIEVFD